MRVDIRILVFILGVSFIGMQAMTAERTSTVEKAPLVKKPTIKLVRFEGGCFNAKVNKKLVMWCA